MAGPYKYFYHYSDTHLFGNLTGPNNWSVLVPFDEATRWPSVIAELNRLHAEVERLREENAQLLDALRELYDFSEPALSAKYRDRSTNAFERALEVLQRLEARED